MNKALLEEARRIYDADLPTYHRWLVHGDGSPCEDGCDKAPIPERMEALERAFAEILEREGSA